MQATKTESGRLRRKRTSLKIGAPSDTQEGQEIRLNPKLQEQKPKSLHRISVCLKKQKLNLPPSCCRSPVLYLCPSSTRNSIWPHPPPSATPEPHFYRREAAKVVIADANFTGKWILLFMLIASYFKSHESVSNWRRSWIILLYPHWEGRLGIELVACLLPGGGRTPKRTKKQKQQRKKAKTSKECRASKRC